MSIVTFYSYKGGVGRTMALANVATVLARSGYRVLAVDWDLEAPGLEEYFEGFRVKPNGRGLLQLLWDVGGGADADYCTHLWRLESASEETSLTLLPSGREEENYYPMLERFSQDNFFESGGGDYLERLREQWLEDFDFVLIDSRTGLSDAGGVCTIQLPDIVVAMFTATRQSLHGVRDMMRLALDGRQRFAYDRMELSVIPVACRVDTARNPEEANQWLDDCSEVLQEFYDDWLPADMSRREVLETLAVQHEPRLLHGARLAVHPVTADASATGAVNSYKRLAGLLESNLEDLKLLGPDIQISHTPKAPKLERTADYKFDAFLSYPRGGHVSAWVGDFFLPVLTNWLENEIPRPPRIFFDRAELSAGMSYPSMLEEALRTSRTMVAILSPTFFRSRWCVAEFQTFEKREELTATNLILPIVFHNGELFPDYAKRRQSLDLREFAITAGAFRESAMFVEFEQTVKRFAADLAQTVNGAPEYSADWPMVDPANVEVDRDFKPKLPRLDF